MRPCPRRFRTTVSICEGTVYHSHVAGTFFAIVGEMIITPTSLTITQLLGSSNEQYVVPSYQRRYSWKEKQLWELLDDISLIDGSDTHLLGSIVCLTGQHVAGMNKLELVDGQQRLTTVSILLQCLHERLIREGEVAEAQDIGRLLTAKALGGTPVRKVALDSLDSNEFDRLISGSEIISPQNVNLCAAFKVFRDWVHGRKLPELATFLYRLRNQAIVIRLDVSEAKDAFKLFETINNRGLRLSPTDIIKNFLLGNAARFSQEALSLARLRWADLIRYLDGTNTETFFRQYLCARYKKRITVSYVISHFKKLFMQEVVEAAGLPDRHWYLDDEPLVDEVTDDVDEAVDEIDEFEAEEEPAGINRVSFALFLDALVASAKAFGEIVHCKTGHTQIDRHLRNLKMIKSVQTYGLLMHLRVGGCGDNDFQAILKLTESFLLRRHVCRQRSNENELAFAKLCGTDPSDAIAEVIATYREYSPSDEKFKEEFARTSFGAALIDRARYCLEQFELQRQGVHLELFVGGPDTVHVEHIIPQKIKTRKAKEQFGDWPNYLGSNATERHPRFVSRIGNLTLFAGPLNIGASNNPYKRKKASYLNSAIKITSSLPDDYPEFRFPQVDKRSDTLAELAVTIWPIA
jgi:hypothetical protein